MKRRFLQSAIILSVILLLPACEESEPEPVYVIFPDQDFEAVIRGALDMPTGAITDEDLLTITRLSGTRIDDITGIEYCTNLTSLSLSYTNISDISPLSGLTNLAELLLRNSQISDISPLSDLVNLTTLSLSGNRIWNISTLVQNTGINQGDYVGLWNNPLGEASINTYIPQLRVRGVLVGF